eukprot:COSAG01_NODE_16305_length_1248_cov_1.151436_1_plen_229_part_10
MLGGCAGTFDETEGVVCHGCSLFLCHACFGSTVVAHECGVGGRHDSHITGAGQGSEQQSPPGSLPCPLFPQGCSVGHIPLDTIQRAMLHPANRGRDRAAEDILSAGHSPHKLHLLARRRYAESQLHESSGGGDTEEDGAGVEELMQENFLTRTRTELTASLQMTGVVLARTRSSSRALFVERQSELEQLLEALRRAPPAAAIPLARRRCCAQCGGIFAAFEGGQCLFFR